jgi:hypothetical protein
MIINAEFERIKVIKAFSSLQWLERYNAAGEFEIHCDRRFLDAILDGKYVYRRDKKHMGVIEDRAYDGVTGDVTAKGRFLESLLMKRVISTTANFSGTVEDVCRSMVTQFCLTGERAIPRLNLGAYAGGIGGNLSIQRTGKTVYDAVSEILNERGMGFRIWYDMPNAAMLFEVYQGADRTMAQNANTWCVFSQSFHNVISEKYEKYSDLRNLAYVAGAGEGDERVVQIVDITGGAERLELYVDARDIQPQEGQTNEEYLQLLTNRGLAKLAEYGEEETISLEIDVNNTAFFELGDKCAYRQSDLDLTAEGRVTEIYETIEDNGLTVSIVLGKEQLDIARKIKRSTD